MKRLLLALPVLAVLVAVPGAGANTAVFEFQIDMYGDQMAPPVQTHAYGFVRFFFNDARTEADYTVDIKGHGGSSVLGADIHAGAPGVNGPVVRHLADGGFIVTAGHLSLSPQELQAFASGGWYVSLKTTTNPQGEMRGQIVVPAGFLPQQAPAQPARPPQTQPPVQQPAAPAGGGTISPPNTGDAGLAAP